MKYLSLVRHAQALQQVRGQPDHERRLSEQGEVDAAIIGRHLAGRLQAPDRVVASPAHRTRRTAEILAAALAYPPADIEFQSAIYDARAGDLLAVLQGLPLEAERVVLVGHNPGVSELGTLLLQEWVQPLPSGAFVLLELAIEAWSELQPGRARLLAMEHPPRAE